MRFHHQPSGVSAHAEESRSLAENKKRALRRLRVRLAVTLREPFDLSAPRLPAKFLDCRRDGRLAVNSRNRAYPLVVAMTLDALHAAGGSYAKAAAALGLSTSQLIRFLRADREVWRALEALR